MIRRSWRTQLKAATTQEAVLSVVSHFLDEWTPQEVNALPPQAWPRGLATLFLFAFGYDPVFAAYAVFIAGLLAGAAGALSQLVYYQLG